jgi:hypothetical protein
VSDDALRAARELARGLDPAAAAKRCGARFEAGADGGDGLFKLPFLGEDAAIRFPQLDFTSDSPLPPHVQALLVYHLATSDGSRPTGDWRAFSDLPDGRFYSRAFQGYTGDALVRRLAGDSTGVSDAVTLLGGRALLPDELATNADTAWIVEALPRVPVAILWWDADDEFPARAELLFDQTAPSHLPTDGCAVLGSWLITRLAAEVERRRA